MNRKALFRMALIVCVISLAACTTVTPAVSTPNNGGSSESTPAAPPSTSPTVPNDSVTSEPVPTASSNNETTGISTLACASGSQSPTTPELTEGPYFTANSPERASLLEDGMAGTKIVITGYVYTTDCKPVANALLDFWQADANGIYDNSGYTLRGHQFTDSSGRYQLITVVPGLYPGRTEHIHVKVKAPNGKPITSQLFFPGITQNDSDGIFNQGLLLVIQESSEGLQGQFNFVVPAQ